MDYQTLKDFCIFGDQLFVLFDLFQSKMIKFDEKLV